MQFFQMKKIIINEFLNQVEIYLLSVDGAIVVTKSKVLLSRKGNSGSSEDFLGIAESSNNLLSVSGGNLKFI